MPRSLAAGDYTLAAVYESSSRADSWYRVCVDRRSGVLSCDCPAWIFNQSNRRCTHTETTALIYQDTAQHYARTYRDAFAYSLLQPLITQWPGLLGQWSVNERHSRIGTKPYFFVLTHYISGNGGAPMSAVIAFAEEHHHAQDVMASRIALWNGFALAAEVARRGGFPMAGQPPEHFTVRRQPASRRQTPSAVPVVPRIGLADILRVGDRVDLGDGLLPLQRAENTLRLFLGEELYAHVERQHFLDVSSACYPRERRVYRLRRDPAHLHERRVRVFEHDVYAKDFCIVRAQEVPEPDHYLTVFLGLLSDEIHTLSVVRSANVFSRNSDGSERETIPAVWKERLAA